MEKVNGETMLANVGSELTKILEGCEDITIVMNVTYSLSVG